MHRGGGGGGGGGETKDFCMTSKKTKTWCMSVDGSVRCDVRLSASTRMRGREGERGRGTERHTHTHRD